ncbi:Zinc finger BED domain-containing protein RICESLEEPER 2 [Linum perenne]
MSPYIFDQDACRRSLANMIILHGFPLSIVSYVGVRSFLRCLQPAFKVVSRNTVKSDILKVYDEGRTLVMMELERNVSRIAVTTDMWSSNNNKRGFMVVTAHFIDASWILQNRILRFVYVPYPHTKDALCSVLFESLAEWKIDNKLSTVTVDNCSTNDAMIRSLILQLDRTSLMVDGIVQEVLTIIESCIEKVRLSVAFWTASTKRRQKFTEVVKQLHIDHSKELVLDCKTRWNSTWIMLSTALLYKDAFGRLKIRNPSYVTLPSEDEWDMAKEICSKLELFYEVTQIFSGSTYPTANLFFPKVCELKISLNSWVESPIHVIAEMARRMLVKFDSYWDVIHGMLGVATILDPRYKMKLMEWLFANIYGELAGYHLNKIKEILYDLLEQYLKSGSHVESCNTTSVSAIGEGEPIEADFLSEFDRYASNEHGVHNGKEEFDTYISDGLIPRSGEFDILAWWKSNGSKYPTLTLIARDILAVPVSTVVLEAAFSTCGRLLSPCRSRLEEQTIEALMCSQNWLRNKIKGI